MRRDVKSRVARLRARRRHRLAIHLDVQHLALVALLDRDRVAVGNRQVNRRGRHHRIYRQAVGVRRQ